MEILDFIFKKRNERRKAHEEYVLNYVLPETLEICRSEDGKKFVVRRTLTQANGFTEREYLLFFNGTDEHGHIGGVWSRHNNPKDASLFKSFIKAKERAIKYCEYLNNYKTIEEEWWKKYFDSIAYKHWEAVKQF